MLGEAVKVSRPETIPKLVQTEQDPSVKLRLAFLHVFNNSKLSFEECCQSFGIATSTAYAWIQRWNEFGITGIRSSDNVGGRPAKLSDENLKALKSFLKSKEHWTTKEVILLIKEKFSIDISHDRVSVILKKNSE